ncbi:MAG: glycine cleavage system protein GcvH [Planctomycetaceae bacterium]
MSRDPNQLLYAKSHEWVDLTDQGDAKIATVGISAFAIQQLTDLVYMALPAVGSKVAAGEEFGEVESVKAVSPLYSPVDGEIVEVHGDLPENLDGLKDDPYGFGWIIKVKLSSDSALRELLNHAQYEKQCNEEA